MLALVGRSGGQPPSSSTRLINSLSNVRVSSHGSPLRSRAIAPALYYVVELALQFLAFHFVHSPGCSVSLEVSQTLTFAAAMVRSWSRLG